MAVLENLPSKTLGFLHVFSSENHFFNTLLRLSSVLPAFYRKLKYHPKI